MKSGSLSKGGPRVPGCYLFMRGVFDHAGTAGAGPGTGTEHPGAEGRDRAI